MPCTNCRLDEVECVVTEGKRRRKSYADGETMHLSPCPSTEEDKEMVHFPIFDDIDGLSDLASGLQPVQSVQNEHALEYELTHHKPHMLCTATVHHLLLLILTSISQIKPKVIA